MEHLYSEMYKYGLDSEDIKMMIVEELRPYFDDENHLYKIALDFLLEDFINYSKSKTYSKFHDQIRIGTKLLNDNWKENQKLLKESLSRWCDQIEEANYNFWIIYELDRNRSNYSLEAYLKLTMDQINDIIETLIKPYIYFILEVLLIETNSPKDVSQQSLGNCVQQIISKSKLNKLFNHRFENINGEKTINLSQLRNIAAHKNYEVNNKSIYLYRKNSRNITEEIYNLDREQMQSLLKDVYYTFVTLKIIYTFFILNNIHEVKYIVEESVKLRPEQIELKLKTEIHSQGFEINTFEISKEISRIIIKDLNKYSDRRAIHSSQFLYQLWKVNKSEMNIIQYNDECNIPRYEFKIEGDICADIEEGNISYLEQANRMTIIELDCK